MKGTGSAIGRRLLSRGGCAMTGRSSGLLRPIGHADARRLRPRQGQAKRYYRRLPLGGPQTGFEHCCLPASAPNHGGSA
jgi:hypothetical protein